MTYQAYLDNIKAKTGKTPAEFRKLAAKKGLTKYPEIMSWLKSDFELGHGHANAIAHEIVNADAPKVTQDEAIAKLFTGKKAVWRKPYDTTGRKTFQVRDGCYCGYNQHLHQPPAQRQKIWHRNAFRG